MALCIGLDGERRLMPSSGKHCDDKSAASARLRKAHYQVVLHTFYSFPRSAAQTHLCVDVCESVRKRDRVR